MPASHRAHRLWTPAKLIAWGERIGAATAGVVRWQMEHGQAGSQAFRRSEDYCARLRAEEGGLAFE
jgi:hypothetical protein